MHKLLGKRFGKLLVVEFVGIQNGFAAWLCRCDCGNERILTTSALSQRGETSCGCGIKRFFKPREMAARRALFNDYRYGARERNLEFSLNFEQFLQLIESDCYYCGIEPFAVFGERRYRGRLVYNGIDRSDNSLGYIFTNCVSCCKVCNFAKRDRTEEEFLKWVIRVFMNRTLKKKLEMAI